MASQCLPNPGSSRIRARASQAGWCLLLLGLCCVVLDGRVPVALAQPERPLSCPGGLIPNGADCPGGGTRVVPGGSDIVPGGGASGTWTMCVSHEWLNNEADPQWAFDAQIEDLFWWSNNGSWLLTLSDDGSGNPFLVKLRQYYGDAAGPTLPPPVCQANPPPCFSCEAQTYQVYFDFASYVPVTVIGGIAACPAGSAPDAWCPPSVGSPVQLWVSGFAEQHGQNQVCLPFSNYLGLYDLYEVCMRWTLSDWNGPPLLWDFDDEQVDPVTGQGARQDGVNFDVPSGLTSANGVSHTFAYSSRFDPIRRCFRPPTEAAPQCAGVPGPAIPGYPEGTPAFQMQVATNWTLEVSQCATTAGQKVCLNGTPGADGRAWYQVDLTQLGAPHPWYTTVSVVPIFVVAGGGVTP